MTFWHEVYVELRRHAGDERLPEGLRGSLRTLARRAYARAERLQSHSERTYSRRQLRDARPMRLSRDVEATAMAEARTALREDRFASWSAAWLARYRAGAR
mgnify:CR=1 FL=1